MLNFDFVFKSIGFKYYTRPFNIQYIISIKSETGLKKKTMSEGKTNYQEIYLKKHLRQHYQPMFLYNSIIDSLTEARCQIYPL